MIRQAASTYTLELSEREVGLIRDALAAYLDEFGHEEAEVERLIKTMIVRVERVRRAST